MVTKQKAPITAEQRKQLQSDAKDLRATARRKNLTLDLFEERRETKVAKEQFELGCWLFYYSHLIYKPGPDGLKARIECALKIFLAGITNPHYDFSAVFEFGERQFDTLFEMCDGDKVVDGLRQHLGRDRTGKLADAFANYGWPLTGSTAGMGEPVSRIEPQLHSKQMGTTGDLFANSMEI